ncbi:Vesicle-associated protein 2-2 [Citrus sinensis]|uniref:Vesicle-associated protein 2-2 n=1 Tax=Citrus sinensis TaxID=2711 RepID=A0ACB8I818_CITSI|nr:Vesicle-associated protein 2-2 [Citrus sinensis]
MAEELLDIQPLELKFTFEVKKQSTCVIQLGNKSDQCVAFKVKTTSPKKYCVRPNVSIIKPKAISDFTVTMQAQRVAPPDLQCKDKFLIQGIVVPFGTSDEDITSDMFAKDSGKYVEEKKLRVILMSPPQSPVLLPRNGELKQDSSPETSLQKDRALRYPADRASVSNLRHEIACNTLQAEHTIRKLMEARKLATREKDMLKHELEVLRRKSNLRRVQVGFPLLFVCMVALIGLVVGYLSHPQNRLSLL